MKARNKTDILLIFNENFPLVAIIFLHYSSMVWMISQSFKITGSYFCKPYYWATGNTAQGRSIPGYMKQSGG